MCQGHPPPQQSPPWVQKQLPCRHADGTSRTAWDLARSRDGVALRSDLRFDPCQLVLFPLSIRCRSSSKFPLDATIASTSSDNGTRCTRTPKSVILLKYAIRTVNYEYPRLHELIV